MPSADDGNPATPLTNYSPGNMAKLTPEERAKKLKKSKNVKLSPALMHSVMS